MQGLHSRLSWSSEQCGHSPSPRATAVSLKGEVVDLWCFLEGGDHGAEHKACAVTCAKAGNPIGLLTTRGTSM